MFALPNVNIPSNPSDMEFAISAIMPELLEVFYSSGSEDKTKLCAMIIMFKLGGKMPWTPDLDHHLGSLFLIDHGGRYEVAACSPAHELVKKSILMILGGQTLERSLFTVMSKEFGALPRRGWQPDGTTWIGDPQELMML